MAASSDIYVIFLFLIAFMVILFFVNRNIASKVRKRKLKKKDVSVLRWRISVSFTVLLISLILFLNKDSLEIALAGTMNVFLLISLLIFFVSFIAIIIVDLLLPPDMEIWRRVTLEMSIFLVLCAILMILMKIT